MAPLVHKHLAKPPNKRLARHLKGYFFPGEAARILHLDGIDYYQLRRLLLIASDSSPTGPSPRKWARFTFKDLVMVGAAVKLAGGISALGDGRHLRLKKVKEACDALRNRYGIVDPLSTMNLEVQGKSIVAHLGGVAFEPATGQLVLDVQKGIEETIPELGKSFKHRLSTDANKILGKQTKLGSEPIVPRATAMPVR